MDYEIRDLGIDGKPKRLKQKCRYCEKEFFSEHLTNHYKYHHKNKTIKFISRKICSCGHTSGHHSSTTGFTVCNACECQNYSFHHEEKRPFYHKTWVVPMVRE